ncbi:MAG: peptidoglycan DD-metalloendopeptidase family protein [Lachnospiraceae bacterium]|nr:peptidoglycan DD-metalloendopeptidase family protein [Lachnospiraceae bacterium]
MKKRSILQRITAVIILAALFCTCFVPFSRSSADESSDAKAAYEKKLQEAKERKKEYEDARKEAEATVAEFKEKKADIESYIMELDLSLNDISMKLFELQQDIEETNKKLEKTKKALQRATDKKDKQYETMKARVRYLYENGEPSMLDVVLESSSIEDLLNRVEYLSQIHKYDNSLYDTFKEYEQEEADQKALLEISLEELHQMEDQALAEQGTLEDLMELKRQEIERVTEELGIADEILFDYIDKIASEELEIEQIIEDEQKRVEEEERKRKEEEERLRKEAEARKRREDAAAAAVALKDYSEEYANIVLKEEYDPYSMIWPLPGDHSTFSKFGYRKAPTAGASTYHKGWDIGGQYGAPIVAVLAGDVVIAGYNASGGNYVRIDHGDGFMTVYCHASKLLVADGDHVQQGQTIALVGNTGVSTGPHLHFGVVSNGTYIDPDPYIGWLE